MAYHEWLHLGPNLVVLTVFRLLCLRKCHSKLSHVVHNAHFFLSFIIFFFPSEVVNCVVYSFAWFSIYLLLIQIQILHQWSKSSLKTFRCIRFVFASSQRYSSWSLPTCSPVDYIVPCPVYSYVPGPTFAIIQGSFLLSPVLDPLFSISLVSFILICVCEVALIIPKS